jgi:predicted small secreted protein
MRIHFAPLAALCLMAFCAAGCNTAQFAKDGAAAGTAIGAAAAADPRVSKFVTKVNATIAKDATKLATAYCPKAKEISDASGLASLFVGGTTASVISDARNFLASFCDAPPSNASQAVALGQQLLRDAVSIGLVRL